MYGKKRVLALYKKRLIIYMNIDIMIYVEPFAFHKCVFGILSGESRHKMAYIAELKIKDPAEKALVEEILRKCNMHNRKYFWQVQPHRNDIPFGRWVEMDIDYILHRNLAMDISIVFKTILAMIRKDGE